MHARAATAQAPDSSARGLATLDAFQSEVHTFTADFVQETYGADGHVDETATGTLSLARPNRFRWTRVIHAPNERDAAPSELVLVADGKKLWTYDVELSEVTVAPLDDTVASSPAMLLSGAREVREGFEVVQIDARGDGLDWVKLVPKGGGSDFASMAIGFEGKSPRRLELVDNLNQVIRIALTNVVVNPALANAVFEFKVPAGVDVIGDKG